MHKSLSHYVTLFKRWAWVIVLGVAICGGITYVVSKRIHPVYQASALIVINYVTATSAYDNTTASLEAVQTYTQLLTNPEVLKPVLAQNRGLTLQQLNALISVKPQPNTQLIELDVQSPHPAFAMQLANEICQSFAQYADAQFPINVQILPAGLPTDPIRPQPLQYAGIGALVGLGLALALIFIFDWTDDRLRGFDEAQDLLGMGLLAVIPKLPRRSQDVNRLEEVPTFAEGCLMLCASLNAAQMLKPFKLVMITSALDGEGKSTIAATVASLLAMSGKRVLLVDADLRRPVLHKYFDLSISEGFSQVVHNTLVQLEDELAGQETDLPMLRVLTAGVPSSYSAELLQSPQTITLLNNLKKAPYDFVIFDTSPLLPVADTQFLASLIQATVLVVDASKTTREMLLRAKNIFNRTRMMQLGVVINKSPWPEDGYIREYHRGLKLSPTMNRMDHPSKGSRVDNFEDRNNLKAFPENAMTDTTIPGMPPVNELEDTNVTTALPRLPKQKPEAEE